jgi:hypothetical protein
MEFASIKVEVKKICASCKFIQFVGDDVVCQKDKDLVDYYDTCNKWRFQRTIINDFAYCKKVKENDE